MFENAGQKIKTLARVFFWIGGILGTLVGIISVVVAADDVDIFILALLGFVLVTPLLWFYQWFICLLLFSYGEIVENTSDVEDNTYNTLKAFHSLLGKQQAKKANGASEVCLSANGETPARYGGAYGDKPMSNMRYNGEE